MPELRLGTASWSAESWSGVFYPHGLPASEYLAFYAQHFDTVEVDATFYRAPTARTVDGWKAKTPDGFLFAVTVPQSVTHDACLVNCAAELAEFLSVMKRLGGKLGPVLFQFPYFKKTRFDGPEPFMRRLEPVLDTLPEGQYAVEVRNKSWLQPPFLDMLHERNVALALIDHPWMPTAARYGQIPGIVTADFLYVRWLGDRYGIEDITTKWDRLVIDRRRETTEWVRLLRELNQRVARTYTYYNNHYAGFAVASAHLFMSLWEQPDA